VSRRHATLEADAEGWRLRNESRKNPTQVDGHAVAEAALGERHWLRFGDVLCEFALGSEREHAETQARRAHRQAQSTALGDEMAALPAGRGLLRQVVQAVAQLAECERGLLLLRDGSGWRLAEAYPAGDAVARMLPASSAALARVVAEGRPIAVNDVLLDDHLAARPSLVSGGVRALLALPLRQDGRIDAVLYADRRALGQPLTDFDLELATAFAERAALCIAAQRAIAGLGELPLWNAAGAAAA
jgi:GAF domain-containing protein